MSVENNAINGEQLINENPDILKKVEPESELQEWLVNYVGNKHSPEDDVVTIEMILQTMSEEFPEFLLPLAEENFVRGYKQALEDVDEGKRAYEEALAELEEQKKNV
jgi:uncharacterized iron-regulated protein